LDNRYPGPGVHDRAAQLPHRYRWHDEDLAGRRLCPYRANGFDGKVLRRWWGIANAYCNSDSYCHSDGHANTDGNANGYSYSNTYCHADGHTNTDGNANCYCNSYSYCNSNSDRHAHGDGNINPVYREVFTDTEASTNCGAAPVVAGRADLSAVVPRLRHEGG
jgi:hypothetical protein